MRWHTATKSKSEVTFITTRDIFKENPTLRFYFFAYLHELKLSKVNISKIFKVKKVLQLSELTVSVNGVEHGHYPLFEGRRQIIVFFPLADILQRGLKFLNSYRPVLKASW